MQIQVEIKNVYGKPVVYPVCKKAKTLADLAGNKTLTPANLAQIKKLGFVVKVVAFGVEVGNLVAA
jgi:hypothetical protein